MPTCCSRASAPASPQRLGIDYETLRARNPRLIYCAITGYGQDGPYRDRVGHDVNYLGFAGVLDFIGEADRPPIIPGVQIADIGAGSLMAALGILSAVIARQQTGRGQFVDVAMLDGAVAWNCYQVLLQQLGQHPARGKSSSPAATRATRSTRRATAATSPSAHTSRTSGRTLCRHFGREDFVDRQWDEAAREEMLRFFRAAFRQKTLAEWMAELGEKEICFGPVNTRRRDVRRPAGTPSPHGDRRDPVPTRTLGSPIKLSDTPASIRTPPPTFGADTDDVLRALGLGDAEIADSALTASCEVSVQR